VKYSLRLPVSFNSAPILLSKAVGGMALEPAATFVLKEVQIHVKQCLSLGDEVSYWFCDSVYSAMQALGMQSAEDVCSVSDSKVTKHILASTPVFCMHTLLQHTYWGDVGGEFQQG